MIHIDLHTHSVASYDGGISEQAYRDALGAKLDIIAITDHNRIDVAMKLHRELGDAIIVGEEISTDAGDIIGLYLTEAIESHQPLHKAVAAIKAQGGLVYIPHPFETIRKGLTTDSLDRIRDNIDIVETQNGRAFAQDRHQQAVSWAQQYTIAPATSSDAHHPHGLGKSYTKLTTWPTSQTLVQLLHTGIHVYKRPGIRSLTAPKINRIKKSLTRSTSAH